MSTGPKQPEIRLFGGPGDRQTFTREDWATRILSAQRMRRTAADPAGWALGYERAGSGSSLPETWNWVGVDCHPIDQVDPELLRPYGAGLHDLLPQHDEAARPSNATSRPSA